MASRECYLNGTWSSVDYTPCMELYDWIIQIEYYFHVSVIIKFCGSLISLLLLLITFFIFISFSSIQCHRLSVHKNLVIAFILYYILNIIFWEPVLTGVSQKRSPSHFDHKWVENLLNSMMIFCQMAFTNWLFNEGFYLHSRVTTNIFDSEAPFIFFHIFGWGLPVCCIATWMVVMSLTTGINASWDVTESDYIWIILGPMIGVILMNMMFLVNIVRVLVTKLKATSTPEADPTLRYVAEMAIHNGNGTSIKDKISSPVNYLTGLKVNVVRPQRPQRPRVRNVFPYGTDRMSALLWWKTMKAVFVLFGFLGFSHFAFFYNPKDKGFWEVTYLIANAVLQGSQGILVSILYCFCSPDVRLALNKRYYRLKVRWQSRNLRKENTERFQQSVKQRLSLPSVNFHKSSEGTIQHWPKSFSHGHQIEISPEDLKQHSESHGGSIQLMAINENGFAKKSKTEVCHFDCRANGLAVKVWIHSGSSPASLAMGSPEGSSNVLVQESCV